jgi:hypothetical protein
VLTAKDILLVILLSRKRFRKKFFTDSRRVRFASQILERNLVHHLGGEPKFGAMLFQHRKTLGCRKASAWHAKSSMLVLVGAPQAPFRELHLRNEASGATKNVSLAIFLVEAHVFRCVSL